MKTLILVLIFFSFLQTTIIPVNIVLIILICRAYLRTDPKNLFLAFAFGLLISHLNLTILGLQSITYLIIVEITQALAKSRLASNSLLIIPITLILLSLNQLANSFIIHQTVQLFPNLIIEGFLSLPIFYLIRLWEERFIVHKEIKLRI